MVPPVCVILRSNAYYTMKTKKCKDFFVDFRAGLFLAGRSGQVFRLVKVRLPNPSYKDPIAEVHTGLTDRHNG